MANNRVAQRPKVLDQRACGLWGAGSNSRRSFILGLIGELKHRRTPFMQKVNQAILSNSLETIEGRREQANRAHQWGWVEPG
jgi:hypothetical protein